MCCKRIYDFTLCGIIKFMDVGLFFLLLAGHYLADFTLQPPFVAENKKLVFLEPIGFHALTSHAMTHGLVAGFLSSSYAAGLVVGISHWLIDLRASRYLQDKLGKKEPLLSLHADQLLHTLVIAFTVLAVV